MLGGKNFSLYSDEDYEIEFKSYNSMKENEVRLEFNKEILDGFKNELNFDKIPSMQNLNIKLVYLNGEEVIVLNNNVGDNVEIPTVLETLEVLGDLEKFKTCAMNKCDVELYLQYEYVANNIPQTRLVKINFMDNSNKYAIDNSVATKTAERLKNSEAREYNIKDLNITRGNDVFDTANSVLF